MTDLIPEKLCSLADQFLSASQVLNDAWTDSLRIVNTPGDALGRSANAGTTATAIQEVVSKAQTTVDVLVGAMESDMDDLYATAFAFSGVDEEAARSVESNYRLPPESPPNPGPTSGSRPTAAN